MSRWQSCEMDLTLQLHFRAPRGTERSRMTNVA
jgi:hypothetical protein